MPRRRLTVIAVAVAVAAAACSSIDDADRAAPDTTLVVAASELPVSFNWNESGNESAITNDLAQLLFFYAYKVGPNYETAHPGLAGAPEIVATSPKQVIRWTIARDAMWSDGTPVTTEDMRYFYEQPAVPDSGFAEHEGYDRIEKFDVIDDKVFEATFDPSYPDFLSLFNAVPQAEWVRTHGGFADALDKNPGPSAGPYRFSQWVPDVSITLVRNELWPGDPKPGFESIVFKYIPDASAQVQNLEKGEVDLITPGADQDLVAQVQALAASGPIHADSAVGPQWDLIGFNFRNPYLADLKVRQAIAYALDRNAILDIVMRPISPDARRLDNFIYMTNRPEYVAHGTEYRVRNLDRARKLLEEAGWTGSSGVRTNASGDRLSLRISAITGVARFEAAAELAIAQLAEVGIDLRSDDCPGDCLLERAVNGDFDILSFGWGGNTFPISAITHIFATDGDQNFGKFTSPEFDALIAQAGTVADPAEQVRLANLADEALWNGLPGITLYQAPTVVAASDRITGIAANANGDGVFWNAQTWGLKA